MVSAYLAILSGYSSSPIYTSPRSTQGFVISTGSTAKRRNGATLQSTNSTDDALGCCLMGPSKRILMLTRNNLRAHYDAVCLTIPRQTDLPNLGRWIPAVFLQALLRQREVHCLSSAASISSIWRTEKYVWYCDPSKYAQNSTFGDLAPAVRFTAVLALVRSADAVVVLRITLLIAISPTKVCSFTSLYYN